MHLLFLGDIFARGGRTAVQAFVPQFRKHVKVEAVIANAENAAGGFGITGVISQELFSSGVDMLTGGNHSWDQKGIVPYISGESRLLRPLNYPAKTPGRGFGVISTGSGDVLVVNLMGQVHMPGINDPFEALEALLVRYRLGENVSAIVVDFHAEATSEKAALAHVFDGRVSLVVGTHTHCPTADHRILAGGTSFISDVGMCGDYDSVIGLEKSVASKRFTQRAIREKAMPAQGEPTLCGVLLEVDSRTGLSKAFAPLRVGGCLSQTQPKALSGMSWPSRNPEIAG